jgi:hypothetical protein
MTAMGGFDGNGFGQLVKRLFVVVKYSGYGTFELQVRIAASICWPIGYNSLFYIPVEVCYEDVSNDLTPSITL